MSPRRCRPFCQNQWRVPIHVAVAAVAFGRCPAPSHRHRLVDCWICPFRRCGPPIPMRPSRLGSRFVFGPGCCASSSLSYSDARACSLSRPHCPSVSACVLIISSSIFLDGAHIYIIVVVTWVSSGWRISLSRPSLSFHRRYGRAPSLPSSSPPAKRRQQPPSSVVCGKHQSRRLCALSSSPSSSSSSSS